MAKGLFLTMMCIYGDVFITKKYWQNDRWIKYLILRSMFDAGDRSRGRTA